MPTQSIRRLAIPALLLATLAGLPPAARADGAAAGADSVTAAAPAAVPAPPLFVDPSDFGFGISMVFRRIPTPADIANLAYYDNVQHLILQLPGWPEDFAGIEPLTKVILPQGTDVIVVLPGYPASPSRVRLWNMLRVPLRIVMVVDGPPTDRGMMLELNSMHGLERVIATMERPSRSGVERLQRPLSFRVVVP
jgi:hypothetical protein